MWGKSGKQFKFSFWRQKTRRGAVQQITGKGDPLHCFYGSQALSKCAARFRRSHRQGEREAAPTGSRGKLFTYSETLRLCQWPIHGSRTVELCCTQAVCGEVWLSSKPPCAWGKPSLCLFGRTDRRQAGRDRQQARRGFVSSHLYSSQAAGQNLKKVVSWQRGDRRSTELGYRPERDVDSGKLYNRILYRPKKVSGIVKNN